VVKDDRLYLHHMLERCHRIARFIGPGREAVMASEEMQDAAKSVETSLDAAGTSARATSSPKFETVQLFRGQHTCL
jgi:hypothetical protein